MEIDHTKWSIGVALSDKIVLVPCPKCGKPCNHIVSRFKHTYVHAAKIERYLPKARAKKSDADNRFQLRDPRPAAKARNKVIPTRFCEEASKDAEERAEVRP